MFVFCVLKVKFSGKSDGTCIGAGVGNHAALRGCLPDVWEPNGSQRRTVVSHLSFFPPPEGSIYFYTNLEYS